MPRCAASPIRGRNSKARARIGPAGRAEDATLCQYIARPPIANERLALTGPAGGAHTEDPLSTHIVMSPLEFMQRPAALVTRPRLHLINFHGVLAPNAKLLAEIIPSVPVNTNTPLRGPR
jgi:hypothetical protein